MAEITIPRVEPVRVRDQRQLTMKFDGEKGILTITATSLADTTQTFTVNGSREFDLDLDRGGIGTMKFEKGNQRLQYNVKLKVDDALTKPQRLAFFF